MRRRRRRRMRCGTNYFFTSHKHAEICL